MEKVRCSKISVDCIENDPVDVKAGGPKILGFDFFVRHTETEAAVQTIKNTITDLNLPLIRINVLNEEYLLSMDKVWTTDRIIDCIMNDSESIISEARHQNNIKK